MRLVQFFKYRRLLSRAQWTPCIACITHVMNDTRPSLFFTTKNHSKCNELDCRLAKSNSSAYNPPSPPPPLPTVHLHPCRKLYSPASTTSTKRKLCLQTFTDHTEFHRLQAHFEEEKLLQFYKIIS